jgi:hypothetical protein
MKLLRRCTILQVLLLATGPTPALAQLQGTLFTSPEQRAYLDYLRQDFLARSRERGFDITQSEIPEIPTQEAAAATGPATYALGGIVRLRDGTQRIWLNGQALSEAELPAGLRLVQQNGVPALRISSSTGSHILLPGQTLELVAGSVLESFEYNQQRLTEALGNTDSSAAGTSEAAPTATAADPMLADDEEVDDDDDD